MYVKCVKVSLTYHTNTKYISMYHADGKLHTVYTPKGQLCVCVWVERGTSICVHQTDHLTFWISSSHDLRGMAANEWKSIQHLREMLHLVMVLNLTFK